ncbi:hypothetical protein ACOMHN_006107 [Nucella lapillus]
MAESSLRCTAGMFNDRLKADRSNRTQTQQHNQQFTVNILAKTQKPSQIWQHNQDTAPCSLRSTTCQAPSLRLPTCGLQPAVSNLRPPTRGLQPATSNPRPPTRGLQPATSNPRSPTRDPICKFTVL